MTVTVAFAPRLGKLLSPSVAAGEGKTLPAFAADGNAHLSATMPTS